MFLVEIMGGYTGDIHSNCNLTNKNDLFEYKFNTGQWVEWKFEGRFLLDACSTLRPWSEQTQISAHIALVAARSPWLREKIRKAKTQFHMKRLEQLCVQFLEACISHRTVLGALHNAAKLKLDFLKEYCLRFIVKECNYNQIVMSREFETLDQPLMVEIIRRKQMPPVRMADPQPDLVSNVTLEKDLESFLKVAGREFCDMTLVLDECQIPAHAAILAARSSYFEAMMRSFRPENNMVNILEAADKIQAMDMKKHALSIIVHNFSKVRVIAFEIFPFVHGCQVTTDPTLDA
nr:hypothetical protein BaRGS_035285 [Batillaria attramentaria]